MNDFILLKFTFREGPVKISFRILLLIILVVSFSSTARAGIVSDKLTPSELAKVKAGEIVLKNVMDEKTRSGHGVAYGVYKCTREEFWKVIFDYDNYDKVFPRIKSVKLVEKTQDQFLTDFALDATLTTLKYTSYNRPTKDGARLDFGLEKSRPHKYFKEMEGYWQLETLEDGRLLAEYKVTVALDIPMIGKLLTKVVNAMTGKDLPNVLKAVRKRIESGGTWTLKDGFD